MRFNDIIKSNKNVGGKAVGGNMKMFTFPIFSRKAINSLKRIQVEKFDFMNFHHFVKIMDSQS